MQAREADAKPHALNVGDVNRANTVALPLATICLLGWLAPAALAGGRPSDDRSVPNARPIVLHTADGFDWADAAVGAAAGFGAAIAALGGITLARNK